MGIASAFLLGGAFAGGGADGLKEYFGYITVAAFVVAGAAFFLFQEPLNISIYIYREREIHIIIVIIIVIIMYIYIYTHK